MSNSSLRYMIGSFFFAAGIGICIAMYLIARRHGLLLAAALLVAGCGHEFKLQVAPYEQYIAAFESQAAQRGKRITVSDLIIVTGNPPPGHPASCHTEWNSTPVITVRNTVIPAGSSTERIMFHELGHCILGKGHVTGNEIMNPKLEDATFSYYKKQMLDRYYK
jgi:hypothetical protein